MHVDARIPQPHAQKTHGKSASERHQLHGLGSDGTRNAARDCARFFEVFFIFLNLERCCVPHQNLAITSHVSFADALLRRVMSAGALTRLAASKTHAELGELAQHFAQADRSEADFAVFQSCLDRMTEDGVLFDAATERF